MSLEDQTASGLALRTVDADDDRSVRMRFGEFGAARMPLDRGPVHGEVVDRKTFVPQRAKHEVLNGPLRAANRGEANARLGEFYLLGEALPVRRDNALTQIMIDHDSSQFLLGASRHGGRRLARFPPAPRFILPSGSKLAGPASLRPAQCLLRAATMPLACRGLAVVECAAARNGVLPAQPLTRTFGR